MGALADQSLHRTHTESSRDEETKEKKIPKTESEVEITCLIDHTFINWHQPSNLGRSEESGALIAFEIRQGEAQNRSQTVQDQQNRKI